MLSGVAFPAISTTISLRSPVRLLPPAWAATIIAIDTSKRPAANSLNDPWVNYLYSTIWLL
jgi:hypothetical protein